MQARSAAPAAAEQVTVDPVRQHLGLRPALTWALLIVSLLPWRNGAYFSGGLDPVVLAKAVLGLLAFAGAFAAYQRRQVEQVLGLRTLIIVTSYLGVSVLGAWAGGTLFPTAVLSIRILLVAVTVAFIVLSHPPVAVLANFLCSLAIVGMTLALFGLPTLASGRLRGGLIPTNPNQLAFLLGPPALGALWMLLTTRTRTRLYLGGLAVLLVTTYLTGSRTALVGLGAGVLVILAANANRLRLAGVIGLLVAVPAVAYIFLFTGTVSSYFDRGGTESVTTLNSRTIAWNAALSADRDFWGHWFGSGLSVRTVQVRGTYWDTQVLDSSWLSAFVQAGVLGVLILAIWVVTTLVLGLVRQDPNRGLWVALIVYTAIRSVSETGLLDTYLVFLIMLVPSLRLDLREAVPQSLRRPAEDRRPS